METAQKIKVFPAGRIGDIEKANVPSELRSYILEVLEPTYMDTIMNEHLYQTDDLLEMSDDNAEELLSEAITLHKTLKRKNCEYFRLVTN